MTLGPSSRPNVLRSFAIAPQRESAGNDEYMYVYMCTLFL